MKWSTSWWSAPASPASAPPTTCRRCAPTRSFAIVEARDDLGGTWDLFRYPGVRSDSDMHTLGYSFRPWTDPKAIADGPTILQLPARDGARARHRPQDPLRPQGAARRLVVGRRALDRADAARDDGATVTIRCAFLFMCSGYYDYDAGYRPDFPGEERFAGRIVHPQQWPEDLDVRGQAGRRHRQRRDRGDARAGACGDRRRTSPCCSARRPGWWRGPRSIRSLPSCASACPSAWRSRSHAGRTSCSRCTSFASANASRSAYANCCSAACARRSGPTPTSRPTSRRATTPGSNASAWCPTATSSRRSSAARPRSSPTKSSRSPRPACKLRSGATLAADIVVSATGLKLAMLGHDRAATSTAIASRPRAPSTTRA